MTGCGYFGTEMAVEVGGEKRRKQNIKNWDWWDSFGRVWVYWNGKGV